MATALLIAGLVLPIVVFLLLRSRASLSVAVAAGISVIIGWAINYAWATVANESTAIAASFGWVCPAVLVLLTWLTQRFLVRRGS